MKHLQQQSMNYSLKLQIPFESEFQASTAARVLSSDPLLRPEEFFIRYSYLSETLLVHFMSVDNRILRVGVSSAIESLKTIIETIDEFGT